MTDPIFEVLAPDKLDKIAMTMDWNPCVEQYPRYRLLRQLPIDAQRDWLDKNREQVEDSIRSAGSWTFGKKKTYQAVIRGLAEKLGAKISAAASAREIETALVKRLWQRTEEKLNPQQKLELHRRFEEEARKHGKSIKGQLGIAGILGAAQLSGFGVYVLGSTLLGGLGLGFGAFTGLSSIISIVIGTPGWILLGLGTLFTLTGPNYKRILPVSILVATGRAEIVENEIDATRGKLQLCRDTTNATMVRVIEEVRHLLDESAIRQAAIVRKNLADLELTDNSRAALVRM